MPLTPDCEFIATWINTGGSIMQYLFLGATSLRAAWLYPRHSSLCGVDLLLMSFLLLASLVLDLQAQNRGGKDTVPTEDGVEMLKKKEVMGSSSPHKPKSAPQHWHGFMVRPCTEQGIAQGALAVPMLLASMYSLHSAYASGGQQHASLVWLELYRCSMCGALATLWLIFWQYSRHWEGLVSKTAKVLATIAGVVAICLIGYKTWLETNVSSSGASEGHASEVQARHLMMTWPLMAAKGMLPAFFYSFTMQQLPGSLTLGEGAVVAQGFSLLAISGFGRLLSSVALTGHPFMSTLANLWLPTGTDHGNTNDAPIDQHPLAYPAGDASGSIHESHQGLVNFKSQYDSHPMQHFVVVLAFFILLLAASVWSALQLWQQRRDMRLLGPLLICAAACAACVLCIVDLALWVLFEFLPEAMMLRLSILLMWGALMLTVLPAMARYLNSTQEGVVLSQEGDLQPQRDNSSAFVHESKCAHSAHRMEHASQKAAGGGGGGIPHIILRKGYHILALALFVPVLIVDAPMLQVSLVIAFTLMVFLEMLRCGGMPYVGPAIQNFMVGFTDERDSGPVYTTHISLLLGMAVPFWLSSGLFTSASGEHATSPGMACNSFGLSTSHSAGGNDSSIFESDPLILPCLVLGLSGMVCLGVGDTAASLVGYTFGRHKLFIGSKKTIEGTAAGAASMLGAWLALYLLSWASQSLGYLDSSTLSGLLSGNACMISSLLDPIQLALSKGGRIIWLLAPPTLGAAVLEAATHQLDNLLVPVYFFTHLALSLSAQV